MLLLHKNSIYLSDCDLRFSVCVSISLPVHVSLCLSMCVCVFVCIYVCAGVCAGEDTHMCEGQRLTSGVIPQVNI